MFGAHSVTVPFSRNCSLRLWKQSHSVLENKHSQPQTICTLDTQTLVSCEEVWSLRGVLIPPGSSWCWRLSSTPVCTGSSNSLWMKLQFVSNSFLLVWKKPTTTRFRNVSWEVLTFWAWCFIFKYMLGNWIHLMQFVWPLSSDYVPKKTSKWVKKQLKLIRNKGWVESFQHLFVFLC